MKRGVWCALLWLAACGAQTPPRAAFHRFPTGPGATQPLHAVDAFPALEFEAPLSALGSNDGTDRVFVAQRDGLIRVFANARAVTTAYVFLDLRPQLPRLEGNSGFQGFILDPEFAHNGFVYVSYTATDPLRTVVARYGSDGAQADPDSAHVLLALPQPFHAHNGGGMAFGPDGMLYLSSGDGTGRDDKLNVGQKIDSYFGAILRMRPDGTAPSDNPFHVGDGSPRDFVWAIGLRNPWRIEFDGDELWAADIGQDAIEEIDIIRKGGNYGWPLFEGDAEYRNPEARSADEFDAPLFTYGRDAGACIIGGCIYRGSDLPELFGQYVYGDYVSGRIWALQRSGGEPMDNTEIGQVEQVVHFGTDEQGELLICSLAGRVLRLEPPAATQRAVPERLSETGLFANTPELTPAPELFAYDVRTPLWSDGAAKRRWIALPPGETIRAHESEPWDFPRGTVLVKHFEMGATRIETRVLIHRSDGWEGHSYRWDEAGTDAQRVREPYSDALVIGGELIVWDFPGPADCFRCHTSVAGTVLGVRAAKLQRLAPDWNESGLLDSPIAPERVAQPAPARAYLDVNCAHCHQPGGPTPLDMDLRAAAPLDSMRLLDVPPAASSVSWPDERRIFPGQKERSTLWERMRRRDGHGMPPIGTRIADQEGLERIGAWIDSMR